MSQVNGECTGIVDHIEETSSQVSCHLLCQSTLGCRWFTFRKSVSMCILFQICESIEVTCPDCVSGERRCEVEQVSTTTKTTTTTTVASTTSSPKGNFFTVTPKRWIFQESQILCFYLVASDGFYLHTSIPIYIYSWLLRCSSAKGSISGIFLGDPTMLRLVSLFYSLKFPSKLKIKNKCWISLSHLVIFSKGLTKMVSKSGESSHICIGWLKSCFGELWKIWDSV